MAKNIVSLNFNNTDYSLRPYAICSTAATTAAKVVSISDFNLFTGATILVKFAHTNTQLNPTLNVNNTGEKELICDKKLILGNIYEFVYDGTKWVHVNDTTNNELQHIKYMLPDNGGRDAYILIAKLTDWVEGKSSDYRLIGTIYGARGGNQSLTGVYDIVAQAVSYTPSTLTKTLYTSLHKSIGFVQPCIVEYTFTNENNETETAKFLALKKTGSGDYIYFQGITKGLLPQNKWMEVLVESGKTLPDNMTVIATQSFTETTYSLTTPSYFDGTTKRTLLHSGNCSTYALPKSGGTITGNLVVNGNTTLGDATSDTITAKTSILPSGTINLGSASAKWNNVYINNINGTAISNYALKTDIPTIPAAYELPTADNDTLGGIKTNYTIDETNKNYPVKVDNSGNAYVNVPWTGGSSAGASSHITVQAVTGTSYSNTIPANTILDFTSTNVSGTINITGFGSATETNKLTTYGLTFKTSGNAKLKWPSSTTIYWVNGEYPGAVNPGSALPAAVYEIIITYAPGSKRYTATYAKYK